MTLAIGCDVSRWQVRFDPANASDVVDFAIQKVSEGLYIHDGLETMWQGVQKVGIRGGYHYQRSGSNWQAQADLFLSLAAKKSFHIYALDLEGYGNTVDRAMLLDTQSIINYWIAQTNKRVVLYTNINYYNQLRYYVGDTWLDTIPLWIAYPNQNPGAPVLPAGRQTWSIHQYTWTDPATRWGTGALTDANVYNGTLSQMQAWAGADASTPPPPTGGTMKGEMLNYAVNVRNRTSGAIVAQLAVNDVVYGTLALEGAREYIYFEKIYRANGTVQNWANSKAVTDDGAGKDYMIITAESEPVPPPVEKKITDINIKLAAGSVVTTVYNDGTSEIKQA